jgi:hypothetical protein
VRVAVDSDPDEDESPPEIVRMPTSTTTDFYSPVPGLDTPAGNANEAAAAAPQRWLDQNYQFLDESDPYPPGQDPFREWPGIAVGWFARTELSAIQARVHSTTTSASLGPGDTINGTFANTFQLPVADFGWAVMPRLMVGYRFENGLGEISLGYRFVQSEGTGTVPGFDAAGAGQVGSRLTVNVIDLEYGFTDPVDCLPWILPSLVRRYMGVRVAGAVFDTSVSGAQILQERTGNVFVGAGPRVGFEGTWTTSRPEISILGGVDASGVIGRSYERFGEEAIVAGSLVSGNGRTRSATTGIPILRLQAGLNYNPTWNDSLQFSAGYQWERWWFINETASLTDFTLQGPFIRGTFRW